MSSARTDARVILASPRGTPTLGAVATLFEQGCGYYERGFNQNALLKFQSALKMFEKCFCESVINALKSGNLKELEKEKLENHNAIILQYLIITFYLGCCHLRLSELAEAKSFFDLKFPKDDYPKFVEQCESKLREIEQIKGESKSFEVKPLSELKNSRTQLFKKPNDVSISFPHHQCETTTNLQQQPSGEFKR